MAKKSFPLAKVYGLLEPGPVVLVSTAREGRANIMTMSWHTMLDFTPPCRTRAPSIIAAKDLSWLPARRSNWPRK